MEHSRHAHLLVVRLLTCLFVIGVSPAVRPALAQQPDASGVYGPLRERELELFEMPVAEKRVSPNYTAEARARGIEGVVWIEVVVLANGKVAEARVTKSLDAVYGLDKQALKAARKWRFTPGRRLGKAVPMRVIIELTFTTKPK